MERLTKRLQSGASDYAVNMATLTHPQKSAYRQRCVDRLAAYEDTGLEPEQVKALGNKMKQIYSGTAEDIILDMKLLADHMECEKYRALGTVEELAEMVKARGENKAYKIESFYCAICKENHGRVVETNGIYFTRAEAEAALSGGGGDG